MKKFFSPFLTLTFLFVFSLNSVGQTYRILISNDDGIESPLLESLYNEIQALPNVEVIIAAPRLNQSGASHSTDSRATTVEKLYKNSSFFGYAVGGRPSDAVRYGIKVLGKEKPFDLVVSGINQGANVGNIAHMSGTVGAAMEALYYGIPSIAVSQERYGVNTELSAKFVSQLIIKYQKEGAPKGVVISVNIPSGEPKGVAIRPMGDYYLKREFQKTEELDNKMKYEEKYSIRKSTDTESDTYAYQNGYITITPLKFDWTEYKLLDRLESWDLKVIKN
ncbi:5'/3'-nucleotidase SurE [Roseivirga sp.]|uniref:5'/3'-nucleotidase SurE n=1 Tax=Roseivirga sp. TaxID=1964215 RepID=UPI003B8E4A14